MQKRLKQLADTESNRTLQDMEKRFGYHYSPHSFLQDEHLMSVIDVMAAWEWDVMHCMFSGGYVTNEARACIEYLKDFNMGPKQLDEFLQTWNWPKEYADAKKLCDGG